MNKLITALIFCLLVAVSYEQSTCNSVTLQNKTLANLVFSNSQYQRLILSGYLKTSAASNSALYYIFYSKITNQNVSTFPSKNSLSDIANTPLIIWLNGGPGASSMMGNFYENGPYLLNYTTQGVDQFEEYLRTSGSWADKYNVMYVDQPVGTGASYLDPVVNDVAQTIDDVAKNFFYALNELVNNTDSSSIFNSVSSPCSIFKNISNYYLTGESYAGKYVPAIAAKIITDVDSNNNTVIPLKGISIGDGFTNPLNTFQELGSFAYNLGLIDFQERINIENILLASQKALLTGNQDWTAWNGFQNALGSIMQSGGGVDAYDLFNFTTPDGGSPGMNMTFVAMFFAQSNTQVTKAYNIMPQVSYTPIQNYVTNNTTDIMHDCMQQMQTVLNSKTSGSNPQPIKVLVYNGQDDLIVNNMGTMKWTDSLVWNVEGSSNFKNLDLNPWYDSSKNVVGYIKCAGNLNFKIVNKAGHMVPFYQPVNSFNMIDDFIQSSPSNWYGC